VLGWGPGKSDTIIGNKSAIRGKDVLRLRGRMVMKDNIDRRYIVTSALLIFLAGEYSWAQKAKRLVPETTVKKEAVERA